MSIRKRILPGGGTSFEPNLCKGKVRKRALSKSKAEAKEWEFEEHRMHSLSRLLVRDLLPRFADDVSLQATKGIISRGLYGRKLAYISNYIGGSGEFQRRGKSEINLVQGIGDRSFADLDKHSIEAFLTRAKAAGLGSKGMTELKSTLSDLFDLVVRLSIPKVRTVSLSRQSRRPN
jgi:hypothetical protein